MSGQCSTGSWGVLYREDGAVGLLQKHSVNNVGCSCNFAATDIGVCWYGLYLEAARCVGNDEHSRSKVSGVLCSITELSVVFAEIWPD